MKLAKYMKGKVLLMENEEKIIEFDLRGDDLKMIDDIKDYIPTDREDIWGWLCYLEGEIKEQLSNETNKEEGNKSADKD